MSKQLNLDEMLDIAFEIGLPDAPTWQILIEHFGSQMSAQIAAKLGVASGNATYQGAAFAGTCAAFFPAFAGQACPEPLTWFDKDEWDPE